MCPIRLLSSRLPVVPLGLLLLRLGHTLGAGARKQVVLPGKGDSVNKAMTVGIVQTGTEGNPSLVVCMSLLLSHNDLYNDFWLEFVQAIDQLHWV